MKKVALIALSFLFTINLSYAESTSSLPNQLFVHEHWISLTKSYDIETKTQKLGTLYKRFFSFLLTYDFYDPMNVQTATAEARFFSLGAHLDIYDQSHNFIGGVEEKIFNFFPTFEIVGADSYTKLARAEMNFWGTKFYIYDPNTSKEMAVMSRNYFRLKDDWSINITNKKLLEQKNIDPKVFMTVLAVQSEIEDWQKKDDNFKSTAKNTTKSPAFTQQIRTLNKTQGLDTLEQPNQETIERIADEVDKAFTLEHPVIEEQNNQEQIKEFTSYCLDLIQSPNVPDIKKKAILILLQTRLNTDLS